MNGKLQMLRVEVSSDRAAFAARLDELARLPVEADTTDAGVLARTAIALHHAYGSLEAALARTARALDTDPVGANWHRALLETMALEVPGVRPAVLPPDVLPDLRDLLAFRHFFRHGYQVAIDPARLAGVLERALRARPAVEAALLAFETWLQRMAERS